METPLKTARELLKSKRYDEARRLLKTLDHPKAREWLARLDTIQTSSAKGMKPEVMPIYAPSQTLKLAKPLPDIQPKPSQSDQRFWLTIFIVVGVIILIVMLVFILPQFGSNAQPISPGNTITVVSAVILAIGVFGLRYAVRGTIFSTPLGFRVLILGGVLVFVGVTYLINSQRRITLDDTALSLTYPATWILESVDEDEDCLSDPEWRRCILIVSNGYTGNWVWLVLKEDTLDYDTTLVGEDEYHWSWIVDNLSAQLDKQWETTIDNLPANVRQYTFLDDGMEWYSVRFFVLRDSRHLIRLSFIAGKREVIESLWGDIESIYQSIKMKA